MKSHESRARLNHLRGEKSPYLMQHAHNPVDWYPWSEAAFSKAEHEDKPIFLSIGYSTCHWCHVMERESFVDEEVATFLNEHFVSIKVDREERPDVDQIYMSVCQAMNGDGGWPLTIVMTPTKVPYFAATYLPRNGQYGRPGILETLASARNAWHEDRRKVERIGYQIVAAFSRVGLPKAEGASSRAIFDKAYQQFKGKFDKRYGGFGTSPKFPSPHILMFLLRHAVLEQESDSSDMAVQTLKAMVAGGIWDHLGFGFSRYSTDEKWLIPHFEKMLYDNALLANAYLDAYALTKDPLAGQIAAQIFQYARRVLQNPWGGFFSAEDADSEGAEGKFYVLTKEELGRILAPIEMAAFCRHYGITDEGNFEGANVPNLLDVPDHEWTMQEGVSEEGYALLLEGARKKVFWAREKRVRPNRDDKILTSWNALMIAALAKGRRVLGDPDLLAMALRAYEFIGANLRREDGRLLARYRDGDAKHLAYLDDYAFLAWAALELYETTFEPSYLKDVQSLVRDMEDLFWDAEASGFFFSGRDAERLLSRPKELSDGAAPSGNSVATYVLAKLADLTGDSAVIELRDRQIAAFYGLAERYPSAFTFFLTALQLVLYPTKEIVLSANSENDPGLADMIAVLRESFLPQATVLLRTSDNADKLAEIAPFTSDQIPRQGMPTAYVCENFACQEPVVEMDSFRAKII